MRKYDIVYILKQDVPADELRYSLRSVEKNLVHRKVWFYCGKPKGIEPDEYVEHQQTGGRKWEKARSSLIEACRNDNITKQFWLFNDDFFILQPMESTKAYFAGTLRDHILGLVKKYGQATNYARLLEQCETQLKEAGFTTYDYAIHVPMLVDRAKMLEAIERFPGCPMFRSIYGNYAMLGGEQHPDVKANSIFERIAPELGFASTDENSFKFGRAGQAIRKMFPDKSRWEV